MSQSEDADGSRIEDLEVMVAHQAKEIEELSGELAQAFETIKRMQRAIQGLTDRVGTVEDIALPKPEAGKPPHY
ncbi:SlyX family protein [Aurantimonas sp. VKM B-3413]|uniref:SlyX family protein n=1 Tax=Aurantimonas sp. VKM B-3413 TaxID=2779401 RepID=UPI001E445F2F|nr:SlyX family protein [Aurantimonas sp. VKM B-3413]MCB8840701.1 SlyX family protein [Aurantimonas sp. VKM B-3413]